ncbi:hypothetical protein E2C01_041522 [Portunus trituberculatus]|uniref:Uncharacterized protein n=1 Tax=Portunus trituberculatus TaxID=210409 RepID=A0A5B7FQV0_PORTR|nr:hypothetical protein [Portunus trituberculatus]
MEVDSRYPITGYLSNPAWERDIMHDFTVPWYQCLEQDRRFQCLDMWLLVSSYFMELMFVVCLYMVALWGCFICIVAT